MMLTIEKADNGYTMRQDYNGGLSVHTNIESVLKAVLLFFENKSDTFNGINYAKINLTTTETPNAEVPNQG